MTTVPDWRAAVVAVCLVTTACGGTEEGQPVIFEVTGSGTVDLMYRMYPKGEHDKAPIRCEGSVNSASLPWSIECDAVGISTGQVWATLVAQARGVETEFECGIRLRSETVAHRKAKGRWAIAACGADEVYWPWK